MPILFTTAPANKVSSRLNLFFQPAHNNKTSSFSLFNQLQSVSMFKNDPITIFSAPFSSAYFMALVPLVVAKAILFPSKSGFSNSKGEFPKSNPGTFTASFSAAITKLNSLN